MGVACCVIDEQKTQSPDDNRFWPGICKAAAMDANDPRKRETEALIEAIWGPAALDAPTPPDPTQRQKQNKDLAAAMRAYLQQYLQEL